MIKHFGPIYIDFGEYPPYSGAIYDIFETNINSHIQCDNGFPYSTIKGKMLTWINDETWEMMENLFPGAKQVKKSPKTIVCKNVHMFKMIEVKAMRVFISPQIVNIPFLHHVFIK